MARKLMKGCEAIGEAAVRAGCRLYFGYPITPQNEVAEYLSHRLPQVGGAFVQAESEVAASNMVYGAAGTGERVFTSSSSPGISLMQEGISFMACAELPAVIVNIMRCGPGLGGILPSQGDYFQATRGGGHGDYFTPVLAPWSVQEAVDLVQDAFDIADYYRTPVMVLGDGLIGQMMEPVEFKEGRVPCKPLPPKTWATTGWKGDRPRAVINSLFLDPAEFERHIRKLQAKYEEMRQNDVRYDLRAPEGELDLLVVAYGTVARVCQTAISLAEGVSKRVGLLRPITLFPFPYKALSEAAERAKAILVVELSAGQMLQDVFLAVRGKRPVHFHGRQGGLLATPDEVAERIEAIVMGDTTEVVHV